jgi:hypothetical protein
MIPECAEQEPASGLPVVDARCGPGATLLLAEARAAGCHQLQTLWLHLQRCDVPKQPWNTIVSMQRDRCRMRKQQEPVRHNQVDNCIISTNTVPVGCAVSRRARDVVPVNNSRVSNVPTGIRPLQPFYRGKSSIPVCVSTTRASKASSVPSKEIIFVLGFPHCEGSFPV